MTNGNGRVTFGRLELVAKLAAVANRIQRHTRRADEALTPSVTRIAAFITECGKEFELTSDEQMVFLKFIADGREDANVLLQSILNPGGN